MTENATYEPIAKLSNKRGLELFEEVIDEIEAHGFRTWDQGMWLMVPGDGWVGDLPPTVRETMVPTTDCGTVACLYGHIVFKAGAKLATSLLSTRCVSDHQVVDAEGDRREISVMARELLGLNEHLSDYISASERTWEEVIEFRDAWREDAAAGLVEEATNRESIVAATDYYA